MCLGQDSDGVNAVVKYLLFFFNFIFWLIGCVLIGVGAWAYIEKNRFYQSEIQSIYDILFDVSIGVIVVGCVIFVIAFAGCLGALRENITLLKTFSYMLGILFLLEVVGAILIFVFSGEGKEEVTNLFREEGIVRYRDDPDLQSIFDWVQETFKCCGVGHKGYREWSMNAYFNCSDTNPSPERCAVPYSCCKQPNDVSSGHKNIMCGYGVQKLGTLEATEKVYIIGCVQAVIDEARQNLYILGAVALALAIPQLIGIFLARILANEIEELRDKWILGPLLGCWLIFSIQEKLKDFKKGNLQNYAPKIMANFGKPRFQRSKASPPHAVGPSVHFKRPPMPRVAKEEVAPTLSCSEVIHSQPQEGVLPIRITPMKPHKPQKKILNPLLLPPVARVSGFNIVKRILLRNVSVGRRRHHASVSEDESEKILDCDIAEPDCAPPHTSSTESVKPVRPRKTRIYPQRQLRELCTTEDMANLNMSVLSGPMSPPTSTPASQSQNQGLTSATVHSPDQQQYYPEQQQYHPEQQQCVPEQQHCTEPDNQIPGASSAQQQQPPVSFAEMQRMLRDILDFGHRWEQPGVNVPLPQEPFMIPRPEYYPAGSGNMHPYLPSHHQPLAAHPQQMPSQPQQQPVQLHGFPAYANPYPQPAPVAYLVPQLYGYNNQGFLPASIAPGQGYQNMQLREALPSSSCVYYPQEMAQTSRTHPLEVRRRPMPGVSYPRLSRRPDYFRRLDNIVESRRAPRHMRDYSRF